MQESVLRTVDLVQEGRGSMKDASIVRFHQTPNVSLELPDQIRNVVVSSCPQYRRDFGTDLVENSFHCRLHAEVRINGTSEELEHVAMIF